jgi:transposase
VNPLQARRFAQAQGVRAKTDAVDAKMLAVMGNAFVLQPDEPATKIQHDLKELRSFRSAVKAKPAWLRLTDKSLRSMLRLAV